jgi:hypothetical protein
VASGGHSTECPSQLRVLMHSNNLFYKMPPPKDFTFLYETDVNAVLCTQLCSSCYRMNKSAIGTLWHLQ